MIPLFLLLAGWPAAPRGPQSGPAEPLATVEAMFKAMRTRDTALLRSLFEPGARLVGVRTRPDGSTFVQQITVDQWVQYVASDQRAEWIERAFNPLVSIQGTLATVWAEYDFYFGTTFSHCGVDAVQLVQSGGRWLIVSIADTYQRENCPVRPGQEPVRPKPDPGTGAPAAYSGVYFLRDRHHDG